ncbi:filamentous hemagglutinin, partial [Alcanivorax sp. 521-1]
SGHEAPINRRVLTVSGTSAADKTYDGTTSANITVGTLGNLVDGESLDVTASGEFDETNAGERSATAHYTLADGEGGLASNHVLADTSGHEATINRRVLTVSGTSAADKTYDGITSANITVGTLGNLVDGESLDVTASGEFDEANAGDRTATAHYTLANGDNGGLAKNYVLADTTGHEATIDRRTLTISGTTAANKIYDGTITANITAGTLGDLVGGESLNVTASGTFDSANAGDRTATAHYTLSDDSGLASNYVLADTSGHQASISRREIGATVSAADRVYDGTRDASVSGALNQRSGDTGLIGGDDLSLAVSGEFADKNAGENKTVNYGASLAGDDASNYIFTDDATGTTTASITPRAVTVTADDQRKIAGAVDPALTYRTGCASGQTVDCGLVAGESLAGVLSRQAGEEAGDYAILQGTVTEARNANYLIDFVPGELVVDFSAGRPLQGTLTALQGNTSRWDGEGVGGGGTPAASFSGGYDAGLDSGGGETAPDGLTLVRVRDEEGAATTRPGAGPLNMVVVGSGINTDSTDNSL